jgi:hypothetical protein
MASNSVHQLQNDNTVHSIQKGAIRAVVHCDHNGANDAYLYGSLIGGSTFDDYVLIEHFTASTIKEITLPNFLVISGSSSNITDDVNSGTTVRISY